VFSLNLPLRAACRRNRFELGDHPATMLQHGVNCKRLRCTNI
jgi:hypothetical protein